MAAYDPKRTLSLLGHGGKGERNAYQPLDWKAIFGSWGNFNDLRHALPRCPKPHAWWRFGHDLAVRQLRLDCCYADQLDLPSTSGSAEGRNTRSVAGVGIWRINAGVRTGGRSMLP